MATQAVISLVVDESGAVAGVTRFDQRAKAAFAGTSAQAKIAGEQITLVGAAGSKAGAAVEAGFQKSNASMLTNIESTRLMSESLGVHMPRALTKLIAQTEAFQAISSVAFGAFAGLAIAEVLYHMGKEVYDLGEKWLDTGAAARAYGQEVEENAKKDFANVTSIEDAKFRIDEATASLNVFKGVADYLAAQSWRDLSNPSLFIADRIAAAQASKQSVESQQNLDKLNPKALEDTHKKNVSDIEYAHAGDSALSRQKQITQERQKTVDLAKEELRYTQAQNALEDQMYKNATGQESPNKHAADAGLSEEQQKIDMASAKAGADTVKLNEETQQAIRRMRAETAAMGLKGDDALYAQEQVELAGMAAGEAGYADKVREIDAQTAKKIANLHTEEAAKTADLIEQGVMASLTGNARILEDERYTIQQIESLLARSELTYEDAQDRKTAAGVKANAEIAKSLQDYVQAEKNLRDSLEVSPLKGYSRLDAEDKKMRDDALERYHKVADGLAETDARYVQATQTYNLELQDIDNGTAQKKLDLHQKNMDEIATMEDAAGSVHSGSHQKGLMGIFAQEQQQTAKIDAEYAKRVRMANESDDATVEGHADALAKISAAGDLRNAQMADEQNAMRDRLTSTLESAFRDPMGSIKDAMQHEMMEIVANWIMQLTIFKQFQSSILGGHAAPGASGIPGVTGAASGGGIFGSLFHGSSPHSGGARTGGSGGSGGVYGGSGGVGASEYSGGSSGSYSAGGGSYGGSSSGPVSASASGVGSTVSAAASDIPGLVHGVSAAQSARSDRATAGSIATPGTESSVSVPASSISFDENGNAATDAMIGGTEQPQNMPLSPSVPKGSAAATGVADAATAGVAGYEGYEDTKSDFKSGTAGGTMKGMLGDAMAGMAIGSLFGPVGALIGAGVGAAVGLIAGVTGAVMGEGGRIPARDYYKKTIFPQIEKDRNGYGGGDFQSAISDVNKQASDGLTYMRSKWGGSAADWVNQNYLRKEQILAVGEIGARAKGGSYAVSMSAKQFHAGGAIDGFGELSTSPNEGFIHAMLGEAVINPTAASTHAPAIGAMNSGASPAEMASMYRGADGSGSSGGDIHHHYNISAIDAKGFDSFLRNGGARQIVKHVNNFASQYAGDGISG
jgi:hypothetical protein